jgi:hypothetical protein
MKPSNDIATASARESKWAPILLAVAAVAWIATFLAIRHSVSPPGSSGLVWDADWYRMVAERGYFFSGDLAQMQGVAFMPMMPLLERIVLATGLDAPAAVYVTCFACALGGIALLYRALSARSAPLWSAVACILVIASPFSLYFLNGYSESAYLLFMGAFFWALWRRDDLPLAALFAGLATGVRPYGVVLAVVWAVAVVAEGRRDGRDAAWIVRRLLAYGPLCIVGLVATSLYFWLRFGDLFLYRNIMVAWNFDVLPSGLVDQLRTSLRMFAAIDTSKLDDSTQCARALFWATPVIVVVAIRRVPFAATLYAALLLAFLVFVATTGADLGRHLSTNVALPLAVLALLWRPSEPRPRAWSVVLIALLVYFAEKQQIAYTIGYFQSHWIS